MQNGGKSMDDYRKSMDDYLTGVGYTLRLCKVGQLKYV